MSAGKPHRIGADEVERAILRAYGDGHSVIRGRLANDGRAHQAQDHGDLGGLFTAFDGDGRDAGSTGELGGLSSGEVSGLGIAGRRIEADNGRIDAIVEQGLEVSFPKSDRTWGIGGKLLRTGGGHRYRGEQKQ